MTPQTVFLHTLIGPDNTRRTRIIVDGVTSYGEWTGTIEQRSELDTLVWLYRDDDVTITEDNTNQIALQF